MGIGVMYITIPLLLKYVGIERYGIWVTLLSILNWFFFFDLGLGHGLKNKLTESISKQNIQRSKELISSAFFFISILSALIFFFGFISFKFVDYSILFGKDTIVKEVNMEDLLLITLFFVTAGLLTNLFKQLYNATQKTSFVQLAVFIVQVLFFLSVFIMGELDKITITGILAFYGIINICINFLFLFMFFRKHKELRPSIDSINGKIAKEIIYLGKDFFLIQLSILMILTGNNIIIARYLGPDQVTIYDSVFKVFQFFMVFSALAFNPLWPLFTDAYVKRDFSWIKKVIVRLNYGFIGVISALIIVSIFIRKILFLWLGKELPFMNELTIYMGIFVALRIYADIYIYFINATGKIRLQKKLFILAALVNFPLAIFMITKMKMGIEGVMLSTVICISSLTIIMPFQARKILKDGENKKTFGEHNHHML